MDVFHPASTGHFIDAECRGHRGIQAGCHATQWNPDEVITVAPGHQRQSLAFGTGHQNKRSIQVHIQQRRVALGSETDDAVTSILECLE